MHIFILTSRVYCCCVMTEVVYRWQMRYPYPENVYTYCGMCVCVCLFCLIPCVHVIVTR
jgi:hypothetical protein